MEVVIVSGAGGPAGVAVINELASEKCETVIAVDASPHAVGLHLRQHFITSAVVAEATHPRFVDCINDLARKHNATAFISTVPDEMMTVGIEVDHWFPSRHALFATTDKWTFYQIMTWAGIQVPDTALATSGTINGPWIVKPRIGSGSKNIRQTNDPMVLGSIVRHNDIVQTEIRGREFTADCLVDRYGADIACVPRWRNETRGGISTRGETFRSDEVERICYRVLEAVGLTGVANIQGFVNDDGVTIIECNPRFSGGLPLSLAAGADLVGQYLNGIHRKPMMAQSFRRSVKMYRYFSEVFE